KTNRAANAMLTYSTATKRNSKLKLLDECKNLDELENFYVTNGDDLFLTKTVADKLVDTDAEKDVLNNLLDRKLFKRVFQAKIVLTQTEFDLIDSVKELRKKIDAKLVALHANEIYAISDMYENKTYKDSDLKPILIAKKSGKKYEFTND